MALEEEIPTWEGQLDHVIPTPSPGFTKMHLPLERLSPMWLWGHWLSLNKYSSPGGGTPSLCRADSEPRHSNKTLGKVPGYQREVHTERWIPEEQTSQLCFRPDPTGRGPSHNPFSGMHPCSQAGTKRIRPKRWVTLSSLPKFSLMSSAFQ